LFAAFGGHGLVAGGRRAVLGLTRGGSGRVGLAGRRIVACTARLLWRSGTALGE
jgi:hypothetical protein